MLINSPTPITERLYMLYTKDKSAYTRVIYTEKLLKQPTFTMTEDVTSLRLLEALLTNTTIITPFIINFLPIETLFWAEATQEMKRAALYSYDYHHRNGNKKIPNVEIDNWMIQPFFKSYLNAAYINASITNIRKPRTTLNAIISLFGKHQISVRMGHFHLTKDIINGKDIYGVHWDFGLATASFSILRHWLYDDMPS
ncbi:MAG: hypothetical protein V1917_01420 [Candidatus Gottesmanbacteria bacterium]